MKALTLIAGQFTPNQRNLNGWYIDGPSFLNAFQQTLDRTMKEYEHGIPLFSEYAKSHQFYPGQSAFVGFVRGFHWDGKQLNIHVIVEDNYPLENNQLVYSCVYSRADHKNKIVNEVFGVPYLSLSKHPDSL